MATLTGSGLSAILAQTKTHEIVLWVSFCASVTIIGFALATYDYFKKTRNTPAAKRKRRSQKEYRQQMEEERMLTSVSVEPIVQADFLSEWHLRQKKNALQYEFKAVERRQGVQPKMSDEATAPVNVLKNTGVILPYDHNMVRLLPSAEYATPYVNASWIDGFQHPRKYIAAQAPNHEGVVEFFEMIWQLNVKCMVMLNQTYENGKEKGVQYWRDGINPAITFGPFTITVVNYCTTADFLIRHLEIDYRGRIRRIRHFQMINWCEQLDYSHVIGFLEVRRHIAEAQAEWSRPLLVHCNNGSGRTGAYICADRNMDRVVAGKPIDIFGLTVQLRRSRMMMVNTCTQYRYIYEVVANFYTCGYTVMPIHQLSRKVQQLALKVNDKNTGFEEELKKINSFTKPLAIGECAAGHRSENQWKSRDIMLQPPERARPYLLSHEHAGSTDFINAVYVDGYRAVNQYLVTQWPLKSTVNDVWRLVHDHHVSVIAVLNDMGKGSRSYTRFWPAVSRQSTGFGPVAVELTREYDLTPNVKCRIFRVRKIVADLSPKIIEAMKKYGVGEEIIKILGSGRENEPGRMVVMLQTACWPNRHRVPESTRGLLELIQASDDFYQSLCGHLQTRVSPMLVMSRDGVSRAGTFCVVSICIHRMLQEGNVDIFRAAEIVKRNRPQLIDSISEFLLCYDSCLEFYNQWMREPPQYGQVTSSV